MSVGLCLTLECFFLKYNNHYISGHLERDSGYSAMALESPLILSRADTSKTDLIGSLKETLQLENIDKMSEEPEALVFSR